MKQKSNVHGMNQRHERFSGFQVCLGFTLIELLVVISIIALLIAILLPALSKSREVARQMLCMSNEKQMGLGTAGYHNDSNGYFPPDGVWNDMGMTRGRDTYWVSLIYPYATGRSQPPDSVSNLNIHWTFSDSGFANNIFSCPSMDESIKGLTTVFVERHVPYGCNASQFSNSGAGAIGPDVDFFTRVEEVLGASNTVWSAETQPNSLAFSLIVLPGWNNAFYAPALRHLGWGTGQELSEWHPGNPGAANHLFVDGHVSSLNYEQIRSDNQNIYRINKN